MPRATPTEPPSDIEARDGEPLGRLPLVVRFVADPTAEGGVSADVMFNAYSSHTPQEHERLLCAAEAFWRGC